MRNMKLAVKIYFLVGLSIVMGGGVAFFLMREIGNVSSQYDQLLKSEVAQASRAREMQVDFKIQVQEWKNVLLRGSDPKDLQKYTKQFNEQGDKVGKQAKDLQIQVTDLEIRTAVADFQAS